ncbi:fluoride efflux transporter CrcB [Parahaliea mediterranea]|uniref:Fluoride-specific ion channel FluC n=1 Tax=Parahaliea mediterranea TaxID=651086 RepID=A0A939IKP6_9GAMM|nr:fluoride efflux transporter CrcB [Parahaliea mediterranea]MBN7797551.1 fluoride efflux transporter CrcB [Parahaliea mediterranea]
MKFILFVALGGASGAVTRYLLSSWAHSLWEGRWPLGTLMVNVLGSFCIGIIFVLIERQHIHADWRGVLMVGFLGAFTTFSTFSLEAITLLEAGESAHALGYMLVSVVSCVAAAGSAIYLTRMVSASL